MRLRSAAPLTAGALLLATCVSGCSGGDRSQSGELTALEARLSKFQSCGELEQHIKGAAERDMRQAMQQLRESYAYAYNGGGAVYDAAPPVAASAGAGTRDANASAENAHSDTNTQEKGVDEADIIKNDGNFIYVLSGGQFVTVRVIDPRGGEPKTMEKVSSVPLGGSGIEMFIKGDRAVVFSQLYGDLIPESLRVQPGAGSVGAGAAPTDARLCPADAPCGSPWSPTLQVAVLDITDRAHPVVTHSWVGQASYENSRLAASSVRIVMSSWLTGPPLKYWPDTLNQAKPLGGTTTTSADAERRAFLAAVDTLERENLDTIRKSPLSAWIPQAVETIGSGPSATSTVGPVAPCDQFFRSGGFDGQSVLDIATLNLDHEANPIAHASIVSHSGVVYASEESLYIATHPWYAPIRWWGWGSFDTWTREQTRIHKFDIHSDPDQAIYRASGVLPGHVLNQFSMDEEQGVLRVATTVDSPFGWPAVTLVDAVASGSGTASGGTVAPTTAKLESGCGNQTSNHLFAMQEFVAEEDGYRVLAPAGEVRNIACNERIYSARFIGDLGYLVTARQVDPLFVFKFTAAETDPEGAKVVPVKLGELKIPGFSTYIHPLDATHLLTIGRDTDSQGAVSGLQLRIFDVTDPMNPTEGPKTTVKGDWVDSEALYNHKAFNYFAPQKLLAIPLSVYDRNNWWQSHVELKVYSVDIQSGFTPVADIGHDATTCYKANSDYAQFRWQAQVRRASTVFVDGDHPFDGHLYSLSDLALVASPLSSLNQQSGDPVCLAPPPEFVKY